ncbi:MAG: hypothetical protein R2715_17570 [Ilumatobacteraceae bacterium]
MSKSYPVIEHSGDRIVVLARSAEEAHGAAVEELGATCTVVSVERVRSGGLGGFFATELVRLVATSKHVATAASIGLAAPEQRPADFASAEALLSALPSSGQFGSRLRAELADLTARGVQSAEDVFAETGLRPATPIESPEPAAP